MPILNSLLLLLSFCFLLPAVGALEFGFSPPTLEFGSSESCREAIFFSDRELTLIMRDLWADEASKDIREYVHKKDLLDYSRTIRVIGHKKIQVCLHTSVNTSYNGLLIFSIENSSFGGGMWVKIMGKERMESESIENSSIYSLGWTVLSPTTSKITGQTYFLLASIEILFIFLCTLSIFLVILYRRKQVS